METIKLTEEQKKEIDEIFEASEAHKKTILMLSIECDKLKELAFEKVKIFYPQTRKMNFLYDPNKGEVTPFPAAE